MMNQSENVHQNIHMKILKEMFKISSQKFFTGNMLLHLLIIEQLYRWVPTKTEFTQCKYGTKR